MSEKPLTLSEVDGCICVIKDGDPYGYTDNGDGTYTWRINPECGYHQAAAAQSWNHRTPWNCPTYWDGCNCDDPDYGRESDG